MNSPLTEEQVKALPPLAAVWIYSLLLPDKGEYNEKNLGIRLAKSIQANLSCYYNQMKFEPPVYCFAAIPTPADIIAAHAAERKDDSNGTYNGY